MMNRIHEDIHIYAPHSPFQSGASLGYCRAAVADGGRSVGHHQCSRKGVEEIDGFLFCSQHALEVNQRRGNVQAQKVRYIASFHYGRPNLAKVQILSETDKSFNVISSEDLIGSLTILDGTQRKNTTSNRGWRYFDDFSDAIAWLYEQSEKNVQTTFQSYENAIQVRNKLEAEFLELSSKE